MVQKDLGQLLVTQQQADQSWVAFLPEIPHVRAEGKTRDEAIENCALHAGVDLWSLYDSIMLMRAAQTPQQPASTVQLSAAPVTEDLSASPSQQPVYCDHCGFGNRATSQFCSECGTPLHQVPGGMPASGASQPAPSGSTATGRLSAQSLLHGGRYRVLSLLGQGGMGAVYKAQDTNFTNRLVAVKEMRQSGMDQQEIDEAAEAFKREADMLSGLTHSSLPHIYDRFTDAGRWYLVMEFIEGETLEDYLARAPGKCLPLGEVLDVGTQLATVLGYLHSQQPPIIFRDLKSANVMRTPAGRVVLIDFGIARLFKPGQAKDTAAFGSAGYAAPEQYGRVQTSPPSDIYSLGATLHQLTSGDDPADVPFQFRPLQGVPPAFANLIARMLEMDVSRRPPTMEAVRLDLQQSARAFAGGAAVEELTPVPYSPPVSAVQPPVSQGAGTDQYTISCLHVSADEKFVKKFMVHAAGLRRVTKDLVLFDAAGEWYRTADLVLIFVSPEFLADCDAQIEEMRQRYEGAKASKGQSSPVFIPLLVRPGTLGSAWFQSLVMLPRNRVAISKSGDEDGAWVGVMQEVRAIIEKHVPMGTPGRS